MKAYKKLATSTFCKNVVKYFVVVELLFFFFLVSRNEPCYYPFRKPHLNYLASECIARK